MSDAEDQSSRSGTIPQAERVYEGLRDQLLKGNIPANERLVEQRLAEQFQTSRTPIREALRRLEGDGHLVRDSSGGLRPRVPDVRSMQELYEVRVSLEDLAVRGATRPEAREQIEALHAKWLALDKIRGELRAQPEFIQTDEEFHRAIAAASGNAAAARYLEDVNARIRLVRIQGYTIDSRVTATVDEHLEITSAILAGDAEAAAAFMRSHVRRNSLVVRSLVGEALSRMFEARE